MCTFLKIIYAGSVLAKRKKRRKDGWRERERRFIYFMARSQGFGKDMVLKEYTVIKDNKSIDNVYIKTK